MNNIKGYITFGIVAVFSMTLYGCSPEVGSEKWCANIKAKESGSRTANEVADYAKHCILK
jgi:hypothetical protein